MSVRAETLQAPEAADGDPGLTLIEVTAPRLALIAAGQATERVDFDRQPNLRVDSALGAVPGVTLFRRADSLTANPTIQGLSLRGIGANAAGRVLVTLDGVPLNDPFGGWIYWSS